MTKTEARSVLRNMVLSIGRLTDPVYDNGDGTWVLEASDERGTTTPVDFDEICLRHDVAIGTPACEVLHYDLYRHFKFVAPPIEDIPQLSVNQLLSMLEVNDVLEEDVEAREQSGARSV